jgi:hypothetical protein
MKRIRIKQTTDSPSLIIDGEVGLIRIAGKAIAHNPGTVYKKLEKEIAEYCLDPHLLSTVNIRLINLSSSASKWLYHLLKEIEKINGDETQVIVNWIYEKDNEVMLETGEDFQQIIDLPFNLIAA